MTSGGGLRLGLDMTTIAEVADSMARFGARYLERVYTPLELAECNPPGTTPSVAARALAARFAAKEATIKALGPADGIADLRTIEIRRRAGGGGGGGGEVHLSGAAAKLAHAAHLGAFSLSFSHTDRTATAIVVAADPGG